jgi:hypothetical protein
MFYVFLCINLFVNILLFIVQHDLNKKYRQILLKIYFFSNQTTFYGQKRRNSARMRPKFGREKRFFEFESINRSGSSKFGRIPFSKTIEIRMKNRMVNPACGPW